MALSFKSNGTTRLAGLTGTSGVMGGGGGATMGAATGSDEQGYTPGYWSPYPYPYPPNTPTLVKGRGILKDPEGYRPLPVPPSIYKGHVIVEIWHIHFPLPPPPLCNVTIPFANLGMDNPHITGHVAQIMIQTDYVVVKIWHTPFPLLLMRCY
ncbi:hypothetical protein BDQ17DRAFT_1430025 [Cyathus striatus]|nr:hypothetical protein BDQ17DRAFT_1430025 [Cyathus striatus]